jgi:hypothetical protein
MRCGFFFVFLFVVVSAAWAGGRGQIETVTAEGNETWRHNFNISGRAKGTYNYIVNTTDHAGNKAVSGPFNITIDPNSGFPTVKAIYPQNNSFIRQNINALGVAAGRFGINSVTVRLDNGAPVEAEGKEYWSVLVNFEGVPDGKHTLFFQANDTRGTSGPEQRVDFILDTSPPQIELVTHKIGDTISRNETVKGRASDKNGIQSIEISEDGENYRRLSISNVRGREDAVNFDFPIRIKDMKEGPAVFHLRATDKTGIIIERPYMFYIRSPASSGGRASSNTTGAGVPGYASGTTIIINSPSENEVFTSPFEISGIAFGSIQSVHWRFLGPKLESIAKGPAGVTATEAARAYMANPDVPFEEMKTNSNFSIPIDFSMITDGEYVCEVYVTDRGGEKSEIMSRTFSVSTDAPETRIITPPITRYNSHVITVRGNTSDANGIDKITVSMDVGLTWQDVALKDDGGWEIPLNTAIYKDRVYAAFILAEDRCGVTSFTNAMINIDNNPPAIVLTSPYSGQYVGVNMPIKGRVLDNIELKSLTFQIINVVNPNNRVVVDLPIQPVFFESYNMENFTAGEYLIRVISKDLADNETVVSRKVVYDPFDIDAQIAIYNPLPGEEHTGPVYVAGLVKGTKLPETVQLMLDDKEFQELEVDRFGVFRYDISEAELVTAGPHRIYAHYKSEKGRTIASANHTVYFSHYGPILLIDSHRDGDNITDRPWLRGRAMFIKPPHPDGRPYTRAETSPYAVAKIEVSYDNGRTFRQAIGKGDWKWRLEAIDLPHGTQPVVVRAKFENGEEAVRRVLLFVDVERPDLEAVSPVENSIQRDEIDVYGDASDNLDLTDVDVSLRPYGKFWYSVPPFIRGLYLDVKTLGATYFDVGVGLGFMDNNVRVQGQFGIAPPFGAFSLFESGGRYVGYVWGLKLIANVLTIPLDWVFKDRDWAYYKLKIALGANFSWFSMDYMRSPLYMGAVLVQFDLANVDLQYIYPKWKYFHVFSVYMQPEVWFASTDAITDGLGNVVPKTILRVCFGIRFNVF